MAWPAKGGKQSPAPAAFGGKKGPSPFKGGAPTNGKGPATFRASEGKDGGMFRSSMKGPGADAKGGFRREMQAPPPPSGKGLLGSKGSVFTRTDGFKGQGPPGPPMQSSGTLRAGPPNGGKKGDFGGPKGGGFQRESPREGYGAAFSASSRSPMGNKGPGLDDRFDPKGAKGGKKGPPPPTGFKGAPYGTKGVQPPPPPVMGKGGEKGKRRASPAERIQSGEPVHAGVIRSFNPDKKNGFIDCQSMQQHGSSVYVFQDVLERALPSKAGPGDRVAFFIHWSPKGQPQASSPLIKLRAGLEDGTFALKGTFKSGKQEGGFGFIECPQTREFFGRDVYVNKDLAAGLVTGQPVCFNVYLNRDGMPNAEGLEMCDEFWEPPEADLSLMMEVDTGKGKGKGKAEDFAGGKGKGKQPGKIPGANTAPETTGQIANGVIKSFNVATNYGFIESEEVKAQYGADVFMHGREFSESGAKVGDAVVFEVAQNSRGQPQALNIFADGVGEPPAKRQRIEPMAGDAAEMPLDAGAEADFGMYEQPQEEAYQELPQTEGVDNFSFADMLNANDGSYE